MVTNNTVDLEAQVAEEWNEYFPKYFVSQPPHRDTLEPVYYKVVSVDGPVFWRNEGDDTGRKTSFFDIWMEDKNGFGVQELDKKYTPWGSEDAR